MKKLLLTLFLLLTVGASAQNPLFFQSAFNTATAATPTFSPAAGTYTGTQSVTISSITGGAAFCSTQDGSTPTESGGTCTNGVGTNPTNVTATGTLKAIAYKSGYNDSAVASAAYTILNYGCASPTITDNFATFNASNWTQVLTSTSVPTTGLWTAASSQAQPVGSLGIYLAAYTATSVGATQCAAGVVHWDGGIDVESGPTVNTYNRYGQWTGYAAICNQNAGTLSLKLITYSTLGTATCADGDTIKITNNSSGNLVVYVNGVSVITATNTTLSGGSVGIESAVYSYATGTPGISNFTGGY